MLKTIHINATDHKRLKRLSFDTDIKMRDLIAEAIDALQINHLTQTTPTREN